MVTASPIHLPMWLSRHGDESRSLRLATRASPTLELPDQLTSVEGKPDCSPE